jgi:hypothetical protein
MKTLVTLTKKTKVKLLKLTDFLSELPKEKFDLVTWIQRKQISCNTIACAAGWAIIVGIFDGVGFNELTDPNYNGYSSWLALAKYLEIPPEDAEFLFMREQYNGEFSNEKASVIRRIRNYVKNPNSENYKFRDDCSNMHRLIYARGINDYNDYGNRVN